MPLSLKKNNLNVLLSESISGATVRGGQSCSGSDVDFFEATIDNAAPNWPLSTTPGNMALRTSTYSGQSTSDFYAYYAWGDGTLDSYTNVSNTGTVVHTYAVQTVYNLRFLTNGTLFYTNSFGQNDRGKFIDIIRWGEKTKWAGVVNGLLGGTEVTGPLTATDSIPATFRHVASMFAGTSNFDWSGLNNWDLPGTMVTSLPNFLDGSTAFNSPVTFDTSNITNMDYAFQLATSYDGQGMSGWDVSNVQSFTQAFTGSNVNVDVSSWDLSSCTNIQYAFQDTPMEGIGTELWDISGISRLDSCFGGSNFNRNVGVWKFKNSAIAIGMFAPCTSWTDANLALTLEGWDSAGQGTGVLITLDQRNLSQGTYPNAKTAYDNLVLATSSGGRGWSIFGITWVP